VTFTCEILLQKLAALSEGAGQPNRYVVAFSGGLDSTVLLHALATGTDKQDIPIVAVHVDHGLHEDSSDWSAHCKAFASSLGVDFISEHVSVKRDAGHGPEAAARGARYRVLAALLEPGDWLLCAHHQDDQAETLLLNLIRGSGPAGLAGIAAVRSFADGWLVRPLLPFAQKDLRNYAALHDLSWIDDPSNADQQFDRNFLRHEIMPRLASRWPDAARRLQRSSRIAGDAATLLDELAAIDAATLGDRPDRLQIDRLCALSTARQRNVLRYAIRQLDLAIPSESHVQKVIDEVVAAREDAEPLVCWNGVQVRRYRNSLYLLAADPLDSPGDQGVIVDGNRMELEHGLGILRLESDAAEGLSRDVVERGLELRYRRGGEKFRPCGQAHTKKLKKLLQEASVVPWMRDRIPLIYADGELVAVADLWLADGAASKPGIAVRWENRPAIH
jgi:tRNA(Ile)-lysidine synthase